MIVKVHVHDEAGPVFRELAEAVRNKRDLHAAMAEAARQAVFDHLVKKNQEPNQNRWPKTQFYADAAEKTRWVADETEGAVEIVKDGFAQRLFGGLIEPVNAKRLTIPAIPEAYGKTAATSGFELTYARFMGPSGEFFEALVESERSEVKWTGRGKKKRIDQAASAASHTGGRVVFWLVQSVWQDEDPSVLPTDDELAKAAETGAWEWYDAIMGRAA